MPKCSKTAQKIEEELRILEANDKMSNFAIQVDQVGKEAKKGDEKKLAKAMEALQKTVKKLKGIDMRDVQKALEKHGVIPKQKK